MSVLPAYCDGHDHGDVELVPDQGVRLNGGLLPLPPGPENVLFVRLSPDGRRCAGIGGTTGTIWEWAPGADGQWGWQSRGAGRGNHPVLYDRSGQLHIVRQEVAPTYATGWSHVDDAGELIPYWWVYGSGRDYAKGHRVTGLYEWTRRGDLFVGQGQEGGLHVLIGAERRRVQLRPGNIRFIRAHGPADGSRLVLRFVEDWQPRSLVVTREELDALPTFHAGVGTGEPPPPPPPPAPEPKPDPKPEPHMNISKYLVDRTDVVEGVKRDYPHLKGGAIVDQLAHRLNGIHGLHSAAIVFGRKARQRDGGNPNEDVLAVRRSLTEVSQKAMVDVLINGWPGDPNEPEKPIDVPTWSVIPEHEEAGNGFWRPPVAPDLDGVISPPPLPSGKHAYEGGDNDTGECDFLINGTPCLQPRGAAIHVTGGDGNDPGDENDSQQPEGEDPAKPTPADQVPALLLKQIALLEALRDGQAAQTAALNTAIGELQKQVAAGVKIRF